MASFHTPTKVLNVIDTRPKENEVKVSQLIFGNI